ncbi:MAG: PorT family protein [Bacteroidales bacterium]|nr:PorT family protein [Bacteroidales bacterium]
MKKTIIFLLVAFLCNFSFAQKFHYGIYAGTGIATIIERTEWGGDVEKSMRFGYQLGGTIEYDVLSFLSVGTDIGFLQKGDKIKDQFATSKASLGYLDIPLIIGFKMPIGNVHITGSVAPYTSLAVVGSKKLVMHTEVTPEFEWNFYENGHDAYVDDGTPVFGDEFYSYNRFDSGVSFGVKVNYLKYRLNLSYSRGFVDIRPNESITAYNSVFNLTLAYFFR